MANKKLTVYQAKRDFSKTAEPSGKAKTAPSKRLRFVVQKHDATRLHYDLRLELDGVFKSWAVTKGPSWTLTTSASPLRLRITRWTTVILRERYQRANMAAARCSCGTAAFGRLKDRNQQRPHYKRAI